MLWQYADLLYYYFYFDGGSLYQAIVTEKVHSTFKDFQHKETRTPYKRGTKGNLEIIAF